MKHSPGLSSPTKTSSTRPNTPLTARRPTVMAPALSVADLGALIRRRDLGRGALLSLPFGLDKPATVTIELRRGDKVVRRLTVDESSAGNFTTTLSLKHLRSGRYTLHVVATDAEGAPSVPVDRAFRVHR